jgi:hypothetical protein
MHKFDLQSLPQTGDRLLFRLHCFSFALYRMTWKHLSSNLVTRMGKIGFPSRCDGRQDRAGIKHQHDLTTFFPSRMVHKIMISRLTLYKSLTYHSY